MESGLGMFFYADAPTFKKDDADKALHAALASHNNHVIKEALKKLSATDRLPQKDKQRVEAIMIELQLIAEGLLDV